MVSLFLKSFPINKYTNIKAPPNINAETPCNFINKVISTETSPKELIKNL